MTKKPRIVITMEPKMLEYVDAVVKECNAQDPKSGMTRSRFIAMCVIDFYERTKAESSTNQTPAN